MSNWLSVKQKEIVEKHFTEDELERFEPCHVYTRKTSDGKKIRVLGTLWSDKYTKESFFKKFPEVEYGKEYTFILKNNYSISGKVKSFLGAMTTSYDLFPDRGLKIPEAYLNRSFALSVFTGHSERGGFLYKNIHESHIEKILEIKRDE